MDDDNNKPRQISRAPAPIKPVSGGSWSQPPRNRTFVPLLPAGFVSFARLVETLETNAVSWGLQPLGGTVEQIHGHLEQAILDAVIDDDLRIGGCSSSTGSLIWAPRATWRLSFRHRQHGEISRVMAAILGEAVLFPQPGHPSTYYPFLSLFDFASIIQANNPPSSPSDASLAEVQSAPLKSIPSRLAPDNSKKNLGGRQATHDWDAFWIEVAWYAAKHDLDRQHRPDLRRHMENWFTTASMNPPDGSSIDKKLSALFKKDPRET